LRVEKELFLSDEFAFAFTIKDEHVRKAYLKTPPPLAE
jgi:hypothetical protein